MKSKIMIKKRTCPFRLFPFPYSLFLVSSCPCHLNPEPVRLCRNSGGAPMKRMFFGLVLIGWVGVAAAEMPPGAVLYFSCDQFQQNGTA